VQFNARRGRFTLPPHPLASKLPSVNTQDGSGTSVQPSSFLPVFPSLAPTFSHHKQWVQKHLNSNHPLLHPIQHPHHQEHHHLQLNQFINSFNNRFIPIPLLLLLRCRSRKHPLPDVNQRRCHLHPFLDHHRSSKLTWSL
jgi:hypothetical protein